MDTFCTFGEIRGGLAWSIPEGGGGAIEEGDTWSSVVGRPCGRLLVCSASRRAARWWRHNSSSSWPLNRRSSSNRINTLFKGTPSVRNLVDESFHSIYFVIGIRLKRGFFSEFLGLTLSTVEMSVPAES